VRRGFTLIEMLFVVAIIGLVLTFAASRITRQRARVRIDQALVEMQSRIGKARSLAEAAGSRLGTTRFRNCDLDDDRELRVVIDLGGDTYTVPETLELRDDDVMVSRCSTYSLADETRGGGDLQSPLGDATVGISFTPQGRIMRARGGGGEVLDAVNLLFTARSPENSADQYGFRIFPSGLICAASDPLEGRCDQD